MAANVIEVAGLTRCFGELVAVNDLSLYVTPGEIFGLVGPDGAGKTTTLRMLAGVMLPSSGSIRVAGVDVVADPEAVKFQISYMPQRFGLYEDLTVDENIRFYADLFAVPRRERDERAQELLGACGMSEFHQRLAGRLSGGMKQKLGLVCALIHTPKVMLLDEPTNGVDPNSRREFWAMLYGLAGRGVTILNSTAYLDEAERCHRVALLDHGQLLMCDTPAQLKRQVPGEIVSIVARDARAAREALAHRPGVADAILAGDAVHLFVDVAARRIPEFKRALHERRIEASEIAETSPTIEDLFVSQVRQKSREVAS
jgi:drug efflux transport system ATP-binding protein